MNAEDIYSRVGMSVDFVYKAAFLLGDKYRDYEGWS